MGVGFTTKCLCPMNYHALADVRHAPSGPKILHFFCEKLVKWYVGASIRVGARGKYWIRHCYDHFYQQIRGTKVTSLPGLDLVIGGSSQGSQIGGGGQPPKKGPKIFIKNCMNN